MLVSLRILHNPSQFVCGTETGQKYDAVNIHDNKGRKPVWLSALKKNFLFFLTYRIMPCLLTLTDLQTRRAVCQYQLSYLLFLVYHYTLNSNSTALALDSVDNMLVYLARQIYS